MMMIETKLDSKNCLVLLKTASAALVIFFYAMTPAQAWTATNVQPYVCKDSHGAVVDDRLCGGAETRPDPQVTAGEVCTGYEPTRVEGICGSSNDSRVQSAPTDNLCESGVASPVTVSRNVFSWNCAGTGSLIGSTRNCFAYKTATPISNNRVLAVWQQFTPESAGHVNSYTPLANNCPTGYTPTELRDDTDGGHNLTEDNYHGGLAQLCLKLQNGNDRITSSWSVGRCPDNQYDTGVRDDSDERYLHDLNEEGGRENYYNWCLGTNGQTQITTRWARGACAADETQLLGTHNEKHNLNNEDGSINTFLCIKAISPQ